jgi:hypothetical protein
LAMAPRWLQTDASCRRSTAFLIHVDARLHAIFFAWFMFVLFEGNTHTYCAKYLEHPTYCVK